MLRFPVRMSKRTKQYERLLTKLSSEYANSGQKGVWTIAIPSDALHTFQIHHLPRKLRFLGFERV